MKVGDIEGLYFSLIRLKNLNRSYRQILNEINTIECLNLKYGWSYYLRRFSSISEMHRYVDHLNKLMQKNSRDILKIRDKIKLLKGG